MSITINTLVERGYAESDTRDVWPIRSAYRWTGRGQVNCTIGMSPEDYVRHINAGTIRHCVSCYRCMFYKKSGQKDPAQSWRVVCRGCYAKGNRLEIAQ